MGLNAQAAKAHGRPPIKMSAEAYKTFHDAAVKNPGTLECCCAPEHCCVIAGLGCVLCADLRAQMVASRRLS